MNAQQIASDTGLPLQRVLRAISTGSTCGDMCWHAREDICRCSCGGVNHGILLVGGSRPQRTAKIDGQFYELVAIVSYDGCECYAQFDQKVRAEFARIAAERFPDLDSFAYGQFRRFSTMPIVDRKISETQSRWPEVQAVKDARRLIWARPAGSEYAKRADRKAA